ncbi:hypothetical protein ACIBCA_11520 [Kitasatospora sp. NPDC051170]
MALTKGALPVPPITNDDRTRAAGAAARLLARLAAAKGGAR